MKKLAQIFLISVAVFLPMFAAFLAGQRYGHQPSWMSGPSMFLTNGNYTLKASMEPVKWRPKIGDVVSTKVQPEGECGWHVGSDRLVTITNIVYVGSDSQTGWLVYGDGLPGVDSSWVKPAP